LRPSCWKQHLGSNPLKDETFLGENPSRGAFFYFKISIKKNINLRSNAGECARLMMNVCRAK